MAVSGPRKTAFPRRSAPKFFLSPIRHSFSGLHLAFKAPAMPILRRPTKPLADALDSVVALRREARSADLDPLDHAMVGAPADLSEVMHAEGETLDVLRRRMVRLGIETLG